MQFLHPVSVFKCVCRKSSTYKVLSELIFVVYNVLYAGIEAPTIPPAVGSCSKSYIPTFRITDCNRVEDVLSVNSGNSVVSAVVMAMLMTVDRNVAHHEHKARELRELCAAVCRDTWNKEGRESCLLHEYLEFLVYIRGVCLETVLTDTDSQYAGELALFAIADEFPETPIVLWSLTSNDCVELRHSWNRKGTEPPLHLLNVNQNHYKVLIGVPEAQTTAAFNSYLVDKFSSLEFKGVYPKYTPAAHAHTTLPTPVLPFCLLLCPSPFL